VAIPTFVDVVNRFPGSGWVVDLKADGTEAPLASLIEREGLHSRVIVGSFSETRLARFRDLTGGRVATSTGPRETLRTVMAAGPLAKMVARSVDLFGPATTALQVPVLWYGLPVITPRLIEMAHSRGRLVHVWTVNEPKEMARLSALGVDGLITDRPDLLAP
jgi:glycerophosphoryl diester phosphodiesterase